MQIYTKFANLTEDIFLNLQQFATKFAILLILIKMLFPAMVMDLKFSFSSLDHNFFDSWNRPFSGSNFALYWKDHKIAV
jgi:hypothetical protein